MDINTMILLLTQASKDGIHPIQLARVSEGIVSLSEPELELLENRSYASALRDIVRANDWLENKKYLNSYKPRITFVNLEPTIELE